MAGQVVQSSTLDVIPQPHMVVVHNLLHTNFQVVLCERNQLPAAENLANTQTRALHNNYFK